jgi:hypothetical protein
VVAAAFDELEEFLDDQRLIVDHQNLYRRRKLVHLPLHAQVKG